MSFLLGNFRRTVILTGGMACLTLVGSTTAGYSQYYRHHARHPYSDPRGFYYRLPFEGRLPPGTGALLRPQYDDSYPMHEFTPGGSATGGPVGGLGS